VEPAETTMEKPQEIITEQETVFTNETELVTVPAEEKIPGKSQPESTVEIPATIIEEPNIEKQPAFAEASAGKPETINEQPVNTQQPEPKNEQPATSNQQQANNDDLQIAFEPYHTVDYFASQGIKVKLEDNPDKLSKQLRSFTEWLKTMKKLPDAAANVPANIPSEKKVEQLAETSITDSSVETEAMAEVWIKQGNPEKAIEIYRKLSLLEPSKSPYFASRISAIKII
jgi:hypothetical protein